MMIVTDSPYRHIYEALNTRTWSKISKTGDGFLFLLIYLV